MTRQSNYSNWVSIYRSELRYSEINRVRSSHIDLDRFDLIYIYIDNKLNTCLLSVIASKGKGMIFIWEVLMSNIILANIINSQASSALFQFFF